MNDASRQYHPDLIAADKALSPLEIYFRGWMYGSQLIKGIGQTYQFKDILQGTRGIFQKIVFKELFQ